VLLPAWEVAWNKRDCHGEQSQSAKAFVLGDDKVKPPGRRTMNLHDNEQLPTSMIRTAHRITLLGRTAGSGALVGSACPYRASRRFASLCFHSAGQNWGRASKGAVAPLHGDKEKSLQL
jgi:hypothetical protein